MCEEKGRRIGFSSNVNNDYNYYTHTLKVLLGIIELAWGKNSSAA